MSDRTGIDYSPLYTSIVQERQLKAAHKDSVDLYKKFKFLKSEQKIKEIKNESKDDFQFPPVKKTVMNLINKESMRVTALGEESEPQQKYGRRIGISKEDMLRDLFGDDVMRPIPLNQGKSLYSHSEMMRIQYKDKITDIPKLLARQEKDSLRYRQLTLPDREQDPEKLQYMKRLNTIEQYNENIEKEESKEQQDLQEQDDMEKEEKSENQIRRDKEAQQEAEIEELLSDYIDEGRLRQDYQAAQEKQENKLYIPLDDKKRNYKLGDDQDLQLQEEFKSFEPNEETIDIALKIIERLEETDPDQLKGKIEMENAIPFLIRDGFKLQNEKLREEAKLEKVNQEKTLLEKLEREREEKERYQE